MPVSPEREQALSKFVAVVQAREDVQSELNEIHYQTHYTHPIFDVNANEIKIRSIEIQGKNNTWFCSACLGDGFHEDGLQAGLWVAKQIINKLPLTRNKKFNRLPKSYQKSY